jgi:hypothetical protein
MKNRIAKRPGLDNDPAHAGVRFDELSELNGGNHQMHLRGARPGQQHVTRRDFTNDSFEAMLTGNGD